MSTATNEYAVAAETHASVKKPAPETNATLTWNQLVNRLSAPSAQHTGKYVREFRVVDLGEQRAPGLVQVTNVRCPGRRVRVLARVARASITESPRLEVDAVRQDGSAAHLGSVLTRVWYGQAGLAPSWTSCVASGRSLRGERVLQIPAAAGERASTYTYRELARARRSPSQEPASAAARAQVPGASFTAARVEGSLRRTDRNAPEPEHVPIPNGGCKRRVSLYRSGAWHGRDRLHRWPAGGQSGLECDIGPQSYCPRGVLVGGDAMERTSLRSKQSGAPPVPTAVGGLPGS